MLLKRLVISLEVERLVSSRGLGRCRRGDGEERDAVLVTLPAMPDSSSVADSGRVRKPGASSVDEQCRGLSMVVPISDKSGNEPLPSMVP